MESALHNVLLLMDYTNCKARTINNEEDPHRLSGRAFVSVAATITRVDDAANKPQRLDRFREE